MGKIRPIVPKLRRIGGNILIIGFVKGFWENLAKFRPAKLVETGKPMVEAGTMFQQHYSRICSTWQMHFPEQEDSGHS